MRGNTRHILSHDSDIERVDDTPEVAIDVENDSDNPDFTKGFICAHAFGFRKVFYTEYVTVTVNGKEKKKKVTKFNIVPVDIHFNTRDELIEWIRNLKKFNRYLPCRIVFFSGRYDYSYIRPECDDKRVIISNGRFISGITKNGIRIIDIQNHATYGSLEDWIRILKLNDIGIFKKTLEDIHERNIHDTMATWYLSDFFTKTYRALGINKKLTMPSTALSYFRKQYMKKPDGSNLFFERKPEQEELGEFARESYHGALTGIFSRGLHDSVWYDINSTYVSIMAEEVFPDPSSIRSIKRPKPEIWRKHLDNFQCIMEATVYIPDMKYPPLPVKADKLIFPVGTVRGVWTSVELKYAEKVGCRIQEVHRYIWYRQSYPMFRDFALECWNNRQEAKRVHGKNSSLELFWKTFGNSLYGKTAQYLTTDDYMGKLSDWGDKPLPENFVSTEQDGETYIIVKGSHREESSFTFVELASFITAYARVKMLKAIHSLERKGFKTIYGDTDSIKVTSSNGLLNKTLIATIEETIDTGNELGQWKYEGRPKVWFFRSKWYCEQMSDGTDTEPPVLKWSGEHSRHKGVKKNAEVIHEEWVKKNGEWFLEYVEFRYRRPWGMRESIRRNKPLNYWENHSKILVNDDDKRIWDGAGESEPRRWSLNGEVHSSSMSTNSSES